MPKNEKGFYEFDVVEQEFIPNRENPQRVKLTVEAEIEGEGLKQKMFQFEPVQLNRGTWETQVVKWIEEQEKCVECIDLEGETIENTGYDHTGPERDYPEREEV